MQLLCGQCGNTLTVDDSKAGEDFQCPHCGRTIHVPAPDDSAVPSDRQYRPGSDEAGGERFEDDFLTKAKLLLQKKLLVVCGSCGERLTVEVRLGGKVLRCPACGGQIRIPSLNDEEPIGTEGSVVDVSEHMEVLDITAEDVRPADAATFPDAVSRDGPVEREESDGSPVLAIFIALATGLAGILLGYFLWGGTSDKLPVEQPSVVRTPTRPATGPVSRPVVEPVTKPAIVVSTRPVEPEVLPEVKVLRAGLEAVADGLIPAPIGRMFLSVTTNIFVGRDAMSIDTTGGAVVLDSGQGRIAPLGLAAGGSPVPRAARAGVINIPPSATRLETFVFLVPEGLAGGKLVIAGVGEAELPSLKRPAAAAPSSLSGHYIEAGRYLRLAFKNPVMERLRASPAHRLIIRKSGKNRTMFVLPPTILHGQARPDGNGIFTAILTDGKNSLTCRLRLIDSGRRVILYLSEKPYHQIIYEKKHPG